MIMYFIPFDCIGDFVLKSKISNYTKDFQFNYVPADDTTEWETYEEQHLNLSIYVENEIIQSISCNEECLYKGRNIIGMNIDEFMSFYNIEPVGKVDKLYINDDETQDIYEFDDIGLQAWCSKGIIVTAIVSIDEESQKK